MDAHAMLVREASKAIGEVIRDTTVPPARTIESLETLQEEIEGSLTAMKEELARDEKEGD